MSDMLRTLFLVVGLAAFTEAHAYFREEFNGTLPYRANTNNARQPFTLRLAYKVELHVRRSSIITTARIRLFLSIADDTWKERWVQSKHRDDYGEFKLAVGRDFDDEKRDQGLQTSKNASFYSLAAKFDKFSNRNKTIVIQYTAKHDQDIDCGGGYIKILPADTNLSDFHSETPYYIMFGPDTCGQDAKVHLIFRYKGKNHLIRNPIWMAKDDITHMYTLVLKPDKQYEVLIDGRKEREGKLDEDWDMLPPKKIKDPSASKPKDWDDREYIDDPSDKKPVDWDKPEHIKDPDAKKPEDWDDDMDGEWEPPMIDNPEYKGEWKPKQIVNPGYQGEWVHPEIDNPEYEYDPEIGIYDDWGAIGLDLWQVKAGTIFDNIIITDNYFEAKGFASITFDELTIVEKYKKKLKNDEKKKERDRMVEKLKDEAGVKKKDGDDEKESEDVVDAEEGEDRKNKKEKEQIGKEAGRKKKEEKSEKKTEEDKVSKASMLCQDFRLSFDN
ncbi:unnamed protein product [Toxocara canis]|uniref:Calreticulin n=1 Tax=Toxocara canis TaxID=6265 RepID=A0A183UZ84_TOXCA|nr:unnamed protein product [Toxocara canis]